jgi:hypothetical protein
MGHTFPKKSFRGSEIANKADFDEALQPVAEKVAAGLNEHDISAKETGGAKVFPFASLATSCYYTAHQVKAAVTMALTTGAAYAKPSQTSAAGNTATILDTQEWQDITDDVTGAKLSKSIDTGDDILFICANLQSAGWSGALGATPTVRSNDEYRLQYALRVDGVVYEDTTTGPSNYPDPPPRQLYSGCAPIAVAHDFDYRHIGWQQDGMGLPNHLQPARLTRCVPVVEGTHTVEVVARRITRLNGKPDNNGVGSSMQAYNRRLFVLRIKGWSKAAGSSTPSLSIAPWSEGETISAANLNTSRLVPVRDALNDVVEASIQRGALHNEHLPSVVAYPSATTLNPAAAVLVCDAGAGTASTYAGYGASTGWQLVHDGAGTNLLVDAGGGGFLLTGNAGIVVVLANVQVRRIRDDAGSIESMLAGNFIIRYKDNVNTQNYVAETEVTITPRNQTGDIPSAAGSGTFDSNYGKDQNYCEEDVALLWVFDTAVLLAANPNASTIKSIEVVCATYDASKTGIAVEMETQKATLTAFMLKGITLT